MSVIYLDYNATTPVAPDVLDAMLPFWRGDYGNPSSAHALGRRAHNALEVARAEVAALIGAQPDEIIFTSGGTEASNLAIRGGVRINGARQGIVTSAIVTSAIEHPATEACCALLEARGHPVRRIAPKQNGRVDAAEMAAAVGDNTALVTLIHAQNETGVLQPVADVASAARMRGALMHADVAQSLGKVPVNVKTLGVDLLSVAGHKLYAPKGIGALFMRRGLAVPPVVVGAGQERGVRPGTENVAFAVGLGVACRIAGQQLAESGVRLAALSALLLARLQEQVPGLTLTGDRNGRLPNTLNVLFPGVSGRRLLENCPQLMASTGSACHADSEEPSAILTAQGIARDAALGAVRLSLGRSTTREEVEAAAVHLAKAWRRTAAPATAAAE
jgi:cysteine desulfurase